MTRKEIISGLQMTMDLIQFDPGTGNVRPIYELNDLDKTTYVACKEAIKALKAQTDGDTISRQDAIDAILAVTGNSSVRELYEHVQEHGLSEMWSGGVSAAIDVIIAVPSAQPEHFADVGNMDDGELDFVQKHEKIPVELRVSAQPKPCEDAVSRQTLQKELALYPIDDVTSEDEAGYNRAINDVQKMVLHLPSAQLEKAQLSGENATFDCISRQDAIDHWRLIIDATSTDSGYNMGFVDGLEFCISHLSTMPSAQPEPQWIPCSKRLPKKIEKDYWICTDEGWQCVCRWRKFPSMRGDFWAWNVMHPVVAWMPRPEPYREGD